MPRVAAIPLCVLVLSGCAESIEKPTEVRVSRVITRAGERVITYTAMYDDGIETYIDLDPHGEVDLITVERDSTGDLVHVVREGVESGAGITTPLTPEWERRFAHIDALVDVNLVPWSDAHGLMTPDEFDRLPQPGGQ